MGDERTGMFYFLIIGKEPENVQRTPKKIIDSLLDTLHLAGYQVVYSTFDSVRDFSDPIQQPSKVSAASLLLNTANGDNLLTGENLDRCVIGLQRNGYQVRFASQKPTIEGLTGDYVFSWSSDLRFESNLLTAEKELFLRKALEQLGGKLHFQIHDFIIWEQAYASCIVSLKGENQNPGIVLYDLLMYAEEALRKRFPEMEENNTVWNQYSKMYIEIQREEGDENE